MSLFGRLMVILRVLDLIWMMVIMFCFGATHDLEIVHLLYGLFEFIYGVLAAIIKTVAHIESDYPSIQRY